MDLLEDLPPGDAGAAEGHLELDPLLALLLGHEGLPTDQELVQVGHGEGGEVWEQDHLGALLAAHVGRTQEPSEPS